MNGLNKFIEKIKPTFSKGGKLGFLHSTFEAFESFLFVPGTVTSGKGTHVKDAVDLKRIMIIVVLALVPSLLFGIWNTGYQHNLAFGLDWGFWQMVWYGFVKIIPLYLVSYIVGLGIEFASAQIKGHQVNEGYLVSGMLIPLIVPIDVPLWMLALGVAFAVIIGKEVFGGTGMNIWNPALLCRAFLFFSYPSKMSGDTVWTGGLSRFLTEGTAYASGSGVVDGFSGATPLVHAQAGISGLSDAGLSFMDLFIGNIGGSVGETSVIAILIGAVILIWTGVASWKIMLSSVIGALAVGGLANLLATDSLPPASGILPSRTRRLRIRYRIHGYRPGDFRTDGNRQVDLRFLRRCIHRHGSPVQPGLHGGYDARNPSYEHICSSHRPLCDRGFAQQKGKKVKIA